MLTSIQEKRSSVLFLRDSRRFPVQGNRKAALHGYFVAFSRREPLSGSLENASILSQETLVAIATEIVAGSA